MRLLMSLMHMVSLVTAFDVSWPGEDVDMAVDGYQETP